MNPDPTPLRPRPDLPEAPAHLSEESRERWRTIVGEWVIGPDGLPLLQAALEQWDEYQRARAVLAEDGPVVVNPDSGVVRQHPAASVAKDALRSFRLCLKDLGLDPGKV